MSLINVFVEEWDIATEDNSKDMGNSDIHKYWKLLRHLNDESKNSQEKWIRILFFVGLFAESESKQIANLSARWKGLATLMSRKEDTKVQMVEGVIRIELTPKINVIVFSDNSAIFIRKIAGNAVTMTAKLPNIFNESESTRVLYLASEAGAFDTLKKIRKIVERKRFAGAEFDESIEDM